MKLNQMFPVRLLGFGLYWAWLFLVTVSPSPAFGVVECLGLPFELVELAMRLAFVCLFFFLWKKLETSKGRNMLIAACAIGGPLSTIAVVLVDGTAFIAPAAFLIALVDASIFILWLCFFGHMRVGETALYMSLSYCIGGIICLFVQMTPSQTCTAIAAILPVASAMMFHLSNKYYSVEAEKPELFEATELETSSADDGENYRYLLRLAIALGLCAFSFGTTSSSLFYGSVESLLPGPLVESACCIVLAAICGIIMFVTKQQQDLYLLYKFVPIVLVAGLMLLGTGNAVVTTAGTSLVNLGYLMFEITALNDFCTAAKSRHRSLVRTFGSARIAITVGLLAGWVTTAGVHGFGFNGSSLAVCCALSILGIVVASTIVFTAKEVFQARNVATDQVKLEHAEDFAKSAEELFQESLAAFAERYKLSPRETEIAEQLLRGRTVSYISEQLFIAPGTVKTHMHKIYSKLGIHNKMELLDAFEEIKSKR